MDINIKKTESFQPKNGFSEPQVSDSEARAINISHLRSNLN